MNQTDKIMRQYFVQYPILKSVENYQYLVNFIFVFELLILYLCLLLFSNLVPSVSLLPAGKKRDAGN